MGVLKLALLETCDQNGFIVWNLPLQSVTETIEKTMFS